MTEEKCQFGCPAPYQYAKICKKCGHVVAEVELGKNCCKDCKWWEVIRVVTYAPYYPYLCQCLHQEVNARTRDIDPQGDFGCIFWEGKE